MFGLFRPSCPIDPASKAWVEYRLFWLARTLGHATLARIKVVRPTAEFLPTSFDGSELAGRAVFDRVAGWMGIADASAIQLHFFNRGPDGQFDRSFVVPEGRSEALGFYQAGDPTTIWVDRALLGDGEALVATMAHELAHARLLGGGLISDSADDMERVTDLLTVYQGLGIFAGNSAIRERHETSGNWYAWSIRRSGYLQEAVFGYALAVFAFARGEEENAPWAADMRPNVREAFRSGLRYLTKTGDVQFTAAQYRGEEAAELLRSANAVADDLTAVSAGRRVAALWELRRRGEPASGSMPLLANVLRDKEAVVRREAVLTLLSHGPSALPDTATLTEALERERSTDVRQLLVSVLTRPGVEAAVAVPALIGALQDEVPAIVTNAVFALRKYAEELVRLGRAEEAAEAAQRLIHHPDYDLAEAALRLLARLGPAAAVAVEDVLNQLRGDCKVLRPALLRVLGKAGAINKTVLAALRSGAKARDPLAVAAAYDALADLGPAARAVLEELPDPRVNEPAVRLARATAEARLFGRVADAIAVFRASLADDPETLPAIDSALGAIGPTIAAPLLADLNHTESATRSFAAWALGRLRPLPDGPERALRPLTSDADECVAALARAALGTPPTPPAVSPPGRGAAWRLQSCPPLRPDAELEFPPPPGPEDLLADLVIAACHRPTPH